MSDSRRQHTATFKNATGAVERICITVADCHGNKYLQNSIISEVKSVREQHPDAAIALVLNGDIAGSRGPLMNDWVGKFYKQEFQKILNSIEAVINRPLCPKEQTTIQNAAKKAQHSGTFLAWLRERYSLIDKKFNEEEDGLISYLERFSSELKGIKIVLLPGNCEDSTIKDFIIGPKDEGLEQENPLPRQRRFYWRQKSKLERAGIIFLTKPAWLWDDQEGQKVLLVPSNCLQRNFAGQKSLQKMSQEADIIICHYPRINPDELKELVAQRKIDLGCEVKPNRKDQKIIQNLCAFIKPKEGAQIIFGHIHPEVKIGTEPRGYQRFWLGGCQYVYTSPGAVYTSVLQVA